KEYHLIVDREPNGTGLIAVSNPNSCSTYSNTWKVEFNERLPANWRLDDLSNDPSPAAGDGVWAELGPGKSLDKSLAPIRWSVSLGDSWTALLLAASHSWQP